MRALGRLLLVILLLGVAGVVLYLRAPLWLEMQLTHLGLFAARVQSNYVLTPAGRVHYYEAEPRIPGGGVPLVLVHGLGDRDEAWAPMIKRLKRAGFHVYAPDLLGYGRSPKPADGDYSMEGEARFVYDFIQALGLQKTDLGGWSMGGWVALDLAHDHPEVLDRVVVFDAAGLKFQPAYPLTIFNPRTPDDAQRLWSLMEPDGKPLPQSVRQDLLRRLQDQQWVVSKNMNAMIGSPTFVDAFLPTLPEPLLIVWGSRDALTPLALGQQMHALDPHSELDVVEGCGHLAPSLCAARVAPAVADFLKSNPAPEGGVRTLANMGRTGSR
ncbi:MAG TPA: alpha/beta hydrolase [Acidobacteriaceae bacterium]|nr:alpha/beta hydrolase [Acidobacteriaceae bacterium]